MLLRFRSGLLLSALAMLPAFGSARPAVGLLLKAQNPGGFWGAVEQGARAASTEEGVDLIVKGATEVGNTNIQARLLDALASQKIDAIVVTPVEPERIGVAIANHASKGVRIVVAETPVPNAPGVPYVGYDHAALAQRGAEVFASLLAGANEAAMFRGNPADPIVVQRDRIIIAALKQALPDIRLHTDFFAVKNEEGSTMTKAELMLKQHPNAKLFISTSSVSTDALIAAVLELPEPGKHHVAGFGSGITPRIIRAFEAGALQALIAQVPREIGYRAVKSAAALIRGEKVASSVEVPYFVVTRENLATPAVQALRSEN